MPIIDEITELFTGLKFWELTQMALALVQMLIYLNLMEKYEKGLRDIAETLFECEGDICGSNSLALKHRCRYFQFRDADKDFNNFYQGGIPTYSSCQKSITRGKGKAFETLGSAFRKINLANNAYTPLAMVGAVSRGTTGLMKFTGTIRALNHIAEQKRLMADDLLHWAAIVAIPVEREGDYAGFKVPIEAYQTSMQNYAQGFNSAGAMFGRALYGFLDSSNKNQVNYGPIPTNTNTQPVITVGWNLRR